MKPGLSLRVAPQLALTPLLQQSIRLLQLSSLELQNEVEQALADNPFLEREDETAPREQFGLAHADERVSQGDRISETAAEEPAAGAADPPGGEAGFEEAASQPDDWEGDGSLDLPPDDGEWGGEAPPRGAGEQGDELDPGDRASPQPSLAEHLRRQALALRLEPEDAAALRFLIESLNDDGYLEDSIAQLAAAFVEDDDSPEQLDQLVHRFTLALKLLQSLEPAGVGARNLAECLTLQLRERQARGGPADQQALIAAALKLCAPPGAIDLLARRDVQKLARLAGLTQNTVRAAMPLIARLDPKPGRQFADVERNIIIPDIIVSLTGAPAAPRLRVRLNPDVMPRLRVQDAYARALRGAPRGPHREALTERLQEARWFVKNIRQRYDTILRVATAIAERQRNFFIHGEVAMRPMIQHDLAQELGLHDSTISRITTAKYMATPRGTFEMKYFFGSALGTQAGGSASSTAVRALIKQLIAAEQPAAPLSDQRIATLLKEHGIDCARRTVAKYREGLRIPVANFRRAAA